MSSSQVVAPVCPPGMVVDLKVRPGIWVTKGQLVALIKPPKGETGSTLVKVKVDQPGKVVTLCKATGDPITSGDVLFTFSSECSHPTLMKNMCAECGADLQRDGMVQDPKSVMKASIAVVHSIPELKVSTDEAFHLGKEDEARLMKNRRLVLLVDLDQTLIHTTNENIPPNIKDVYHFQLYGPRSPWYHTRIRPGTAKFLQKISKLYELHICTFGARLYAHTIANFLDQDSKYFSHRILSRDECFDNRSKTANLSSLFPCGDHMVCIIDDREDVWNYAPNLVHVKPYIFFKNTGDINAPPGIPQKLIPEGLRPEDKPQTETAVADETPDEKITEQPPKAERYERRDSIDMPSLDEEEVDSTKTVAASADLEMSDDDDENSSKSDKSSSSDSSSSESSDTEAKEKAETKTTSEATKNNDTKTESVKDVVEEKSSDKNIEKSDVKPKEEETVSEAKVPESSKSAEEESEKKESEEASTKETEDDLIEMEDHDDYLMYLEDILNTIHKAYYDLYDQMKEQGKEDSPDLKNVIPYVKRKVIQGTNLVFSGVVPTHVPLEKSKPYMVARSLGASVSDKIAADTTHLVAAKLGTAKVNDARKRGKIKLVTPDWLWACAERWEHVEERLFPIYKSATVTLNPPAHCSSPEIAFSERCPPVPKDLAGGESRMPETLNPFLAFSSEDLQGMDQEVEDILSGDSSSSSSEDEFTTSKVAENQSSSEDSLTGEYPRGHKRKRDDAEGEKDADDDAQDGTGFDGAAAVDRFRRGEPIPQDYEIASQSDDEMEGGDEVEEDGDWTRMGAELEREFLSEGNSNSSF